MPPLVFFPKSHHPSRLFSSRKPPLITLAWSALLHLQQLLNTPYVPTTVLSNLQPLLHFILAAALWNRGRCYPRSQERKRRHHQYSKSEECSREWTKHSSWIPSIIHTTAPLSGTVTIISTWLLRKLRLSELNLSKHPQRWGAGSRSKPGILSLEPHCPESPQHRQSQGASCPEHPHFIPCAGQSSITPTAIQTTLGSFHLLLNSTFVPIFNFSSWTASAFWTENVPVSS